MININFNKESFCGWGPLWIILLGSMISVCTPAFFIIKLEILFLILVNGPGDTVIIQTDNFITFTSINSIFQ